MLTLGIETSCDETSAAVIRDGREILSNVILSQVVHTRFGGVVPEVASREHVRAIVPVFSQALADAGITLDDIELIAATMGPGLVGPLLVGLTFAGLRAGMSGGALVGWGKGAEVLRRRGVRLRLSQRGVKRSSP